MSNQTFYYKIIRKTIVSFADLFKDIVIIRTDNGVEVERFLVPIAFTDKENYIKRLESDPNIDKNVQITLPRLSYQVNNIGYDKSRKQNSNLKNLKSNLSDPDTFLSQYIGIPYDFDLSLSIYSRTFDDMFQILEYILPYHSPDYTIKVNFVPELNLIRELPIILNGIQFEFSGDGDYETPTRTLICNLSFTVKGYLYGPINKVPVIKHTIENLYTENNKIDLSVKLNSGNGNFKIGETVYQGLSISNATAFGKVYDWDSNNKILIINNIQGEFNNSSLIRGNESLSMYHINTIDNTNELVLKNEFIVNPLSANSTSYYTITETSQEYPI